MKILVTGYQGQLGYDIVNEAKARGIEAVGVDLAEMDITNATQVTEVISQGSYDAVIHCAAYTAVDQAEESVELCHRVNVKGTQNIVDVCKKLDIAMMYFSTDYVFSGGGSEPWSEYGVRQPLNVYGQSKYEGELAVETLTKHFIVRISWVFGINGNNFVKTMLKLAQQHDKLRVVDDQVGSPTYTFDLAKLCLDMIVTEEYGTYHATNEGVCSWYEFACEIFKQANLKVEVSAVDSSAYPTKALRPKNSKMGKTELTKHNFKPLRSWQMALSHYLKQLKEIK
ncbi:MAG: dTDP-4-dehydrorhamnose reductase [Erysipelotrichaceae bacterium]